MYFTKGVGFQTWIRNYLYKGNPARFLCYLSFTGQQYSEMFRSMKNFFFAFLQCAEAWKTSFLSFCSVQKHEKSLFCLSAVCRSMKNLHLVFLKRSEACFFPIFVFPRHALTPKFSFSSFHVTLKHLKSLFNLSAPRLSTKNLFFAFPRRA